MQWASLASPSMMGTMGWSPAGTLKPAAASPARKCAVLAARRSRSSVLSPSMRNTSREAPTTGGARVLEKRYGRAFCRRSWITSERPEV